MRKKLLNFFLWWTVIGLSIWVGGTLFHMLVVVPIWSASPPQSVKEFFSTTDFYNHILNFYGPPWMAARFFPLLIALGLGWYSRLHRRYLLITLVCFIFGIAYTIVYIYPINEVLMAQAGGSGPAAEIQSMVDKWIFGDRLRFAVMLVGYFFLLLAFRLPIGEQKISGLTS